MSNEMQEFQKFYGGLYSYRRSDTHIGYFYEDTQKAWEQWKLMSNQQYAIALQRAIEYFCRGEEVHPEVAAKCPFHANKLNEQLRRQSPLKPPLLNIVEGIEARQQARGFYVPEDIRDLVDYAQGLEKNMTNIHILEEQQRKFRFTAEAAQAEGWEHISIAEVLTILGDDEIEDKYDCPIHGKQDSSDCPRC